MSRSELKEQAEEIETLESEIAALRKECDDYREALELIAADASFNFQAKVLVHEAREVLANYHTIK